jgi:hypothetical protein
MNRIADFLTALAVVAVLMSPLNAQGQGPGQRKSAGAMATLQEKHPYARIFVTQGTQKRDMQKDAPPTEQAAPGRVAAAPLRVVCGTTVFQANPDVDPKILLKRRGGDVDYKLRSMTSPICR